MNKTKAYIYYLPQTIFPGHIGFTNNKKAYEKELNRLGVCINTIPWLVEDSCAKTIELVNNNNIMWIITLHPVKKVSKETIAGYISHEASHVVDYLFNFIGEKSPGTETRAYLIEYIVIKILEKLYGNTKNSKTQKKEKEILSNKKGAERPLCFT